jgi:hypothetical protein
MGNRALLSPDVKNYEYGYRMAYKLAGEQLARIDDIEQQCLKNGAQYQVVDTQKRIFIEYLNQSYLVDLSDTEVSLRNSEEAVSLKDKVLILHYLTQAKGTPQSNKMIAYKELPEGTHYFQTFSKRAIKPLVDYFGHDPQRLLSIAAILGGYKADYGDAAVTINAFPRVSITFVLWRGDEEFPPEGNILFDSVISDYLSTEDITVLCEAIAWKLVKLLRAGGDSHSRS